MELRNINKHYVTFTVLLDLKAFDSVQHKSLLVERLSAEIV